jgi:hypothetical protein
MKKKKVKPEDKEFVRKFIYEGNGHEVSGIFQPYLGGMYGAITDSRLSHLVQLNLEHKTLPKWTKQLFSRLTEEGLFEVLVERRKYTDFLSESIETLKEFEVI